MALFSFKKGVRQKKKIQKSLYFILKKDLLKIYAVLNEFLVNYRARTCASERTGSLSFSFLQLDCCSGRELLSSSLITLEKTCKRDGVKLFPLDRSILEFWRPANQWPAHWVRMFPCRWCQ